MDRKALGEQARSLEPVGQVHFTSSSIPIAVLLDWVFLCATFRQSENLEVFREGHGR